MPSLGSFSRPFRRFRAPTWPALRFAMRATGASSAALALAYWFKLETPQWAPITVWVVAQPSRGMTFSKGIYRLVGTAAGAAAAAVLMACLADRPWLFVSALALWMGACSALANWVMYFRSYGAVLAGYTTSIVALLVFGHRDRIEDVAVGRIVCVLLGIVVAAATSSLLSRSRSKQQLFDRMRAAMADALRLLALVCDRPPAASAPEDHAAEGPGPTAEARTSPSRAIKNELERRLVSEAFAIEELVHYAAAESLQVRMRASRAHAAIAALFSSLSWTRAFDTLLERRPELAASTRAELVRAGDLAAALAVRVNEGPPPPAEAFRPLREALSDLARRMSAELPRQRFLAERIEELMKGVEAMGSAFRSLVSESGRKGGPKAEIAHGREGRIARAAAIRSIVGVMIAGAIWLLTGWKGGPLLVMMAAVNCGVFATRPDPVAALLTLIKSSAVAYVCAGITALVLLAAPEQPNAALLILAQLPFLLPAGVLIANANTALAGTLFAANYVVFLAPSTPFEFNALHYLDLGIAYFAGAALSWAVFRFIVPARPSQHVEALRTKIVRDLEALGGADGASVADHWETRAYHRISRMIAITNESGAGNMSGLNKVVEGALAALHVGREARALRGSGFGAHRESARLGSIDAATLQGLAALAKLSEDPAKAASRLRACAGLARAAARLESGADGAMVAALAEPGAKVRLDASLESVSDGNPESERAAMALEEMAAAISLHREFFFVPPEPRFEVPLRLRAKSQP